MEANPRNEPGSHKMRLKEHLNPNRSSQRKPIYKRETASLEL